MKKIIKTFLLILLLTVTLCGCKEKKPNKPKSIVVTAVSDSVTIKDLDVANYDFTTLFKITEDGNVVEVKNEYLKHAVKAEAGTYTVTCEYGEKFAATAVTVVATTYSVELSQNEITLNQSLALSYDYKALFTAMIDGVEVSITSDMVTTDVKSEIGTYTYIVTVGNASKTLTINVTNDHFIEIVKSYEEIQIPQGEIKDYDFTNLFTIYVDGKVTQTTIDMIDLSNIENVTLGETYEITLTYREDESELSAIVKVTIVKNEEIIVNSKNIITYPNGENIDLTTLFEIKKGDQIIPVTLDMITGKIDYSNIGINTITLNFNGNTYTATVEVKRGVVINYASSSVITVEKGTEQKDYVFAEDFIVIINGIRFSSISENYIDTSKVDFNEEGTYTATIKIPYNEKNLTLSGPKFDYVEKSITYEVVSANYELTLKNEEVVLPLGTINYNVLENISLRISGRNQTLTTNPEWASPIACYAKVVSDELDFSKSGPQEVVIELYVYGVDATPITVSYTVIIETDAKIITTEKVIFGGDTLYTKDLFKVLINNEEVEFDQSMITGKVDTFKAGVYEITIDYYGIKGTSKVVVVSKDFIGTYKTNMKTIATTIEGDGEDDDPIRIPGVELGDMVFNSLDDFKINDTNATIISAIDENTLKIQIGSSIYMLYNYDGVIVIDPNNDIKLGFTDSRRPLVYFSETKYNLLKNFNINYGAVHVLETTNTIYSIDTFMYENKETLETKWFGLKVDLVSKSSADTVYEVTWGEVIYPEDFEMQTDVTGTVLFNGESYDIRVQDRYTGKVVTTSNDKLLYANMTFTGTIDGKNATIEVDRYGGYKILVGGTIYQEYTSYEVNQMKYGGVNSETNEVLVYTVIDSINSIKFSVNLTNNTFEIIEKDMYFGKYEAENSYIFLDGYGKGIANFNTNSYYTTVFNYEENNGIITIKFLNQTVDFSYGDILTLYVSEFLNRLTVSDSYNGILNGVIFDNVEITQGALINIKDYTIGAATDTIARPNFLNNIQIITKDGELTNDQKLQYLNLKKVSFNKPGFYEFTITITINGTKLTSYYALQVIEAIYDGNELVGTYGNGVLYKDNSLMIDKYGKGILHTTMADFNGNVVIKETGFTMKAYSSDNLSVVVTGTLLTNGVVVVKCSGSVNFTDYFTMGTHQAAGVKNFILHKFVVNNVDTYILSKSTSDMGEVVQIELIEGNAVNATNAILKIISSTDEYIVKIISWDSTTAGIEFTDDYRGTYTSDGLDSLVLDGFGNAMFGSLKGTYTISKTTLTFVTSNNVKVFSLDNENMTYQVVDIVLDNSLVEGITFTGEHQFYCGNYSYTARTSFSFEVGGKVLITSSSSSHDDGEDACGEDTYAPAYVTKNGTYGTYSVNGNKLTITVGEYHFEFVITDVINVSTIKCTSTNLDSDAHGYFKVGTIFAK